MSGGWAAHAQTAAAAVAQGLALRGDWGGVHHARRRGAGSRSAGMMGGRTAVTAEQREEAIQK
jgi:hypothetical protein